jgi:hypothetical protein
VPRRPCRAEQVAQNKYRDIENAAIRRREMMGERGH